jgi:hypothetical protein
VPWQISDLISSTWHDIGIARTKCNERIRTKGGSC